MAGIPPLYPLQAADPSIVLDLPAPLRSLIAFSVVLVFGAGILWRYDSLIDRSIKASVDRPLSALGYGVAAHLSIAFFGAYAVSQLGQLSYAGWSLGGIGVWAGVAVMAAVASWGFTVVGTAAAEYGWQRNRWHGVLLGGVLAGFVVIPDPLFAVVIWVFIVSVGIGGPVREWFHAADDKQPARSG